MVEAGSRLKTYRALGGPPGLPLAGNLFQIRLDVLHDTSAFLSFGAGPRFCPGRNLALLQIRTVLAMLCCNFDPDLADPGRPVEEKLAFTMMLANLVVRMKRRNTRRCA